MTAKHLIPGLSALTLGLATQAMGDDLFTDDVIIINDLLCVGFQCLDGEAIIPGRQGLKLKSANTAILFEDSSSAGFADRAWQLTANEAGASGQEAFFLEDVTAGTTPFRVIGNTPSNSLVVGEFGRVGIGTALPQAELHIVDASSLPKIRLEQTGINPYTWDVGADRFGYFLEDVSGGGPIPFEIRAGAPSNSLRVASNGNVGLGVGAPTDALHLMRSDGTAAFRVEDTGASNGNLTMMHLVNASGRARMQFSSTGSAGQTGDWSISSGRTFVLQDRSDSQNVLIVDQDGNVAITGELTTTGSCSVGCDRVFDADYKMLSLEQHTDAMWSNGYLPNVGPTPEDGAFNVSDKMGRMLNELEHAHIYIDQLHVQQGKQKRELKEARARDANQQTQIDTLIARLEALESQ